MQLQHPDFFGGAWVFQPDPIDFTRYQHDEHLRRLERVLRADRAVHAAERPFQRTTDGPGRSRRRDSSAASRRCSAPTAARRISSRRGRRSTGPSAPTATRVPLWDKLTGKIDHNVATTCATTASTCARTPRSNWPTIGPKLVGKLHFFGRRHGRLLAQSRRLQVSRIF